MKLTRGITITDKFFSCFTVEPGSSDDGWIARVTVGSIYIDWYEYPEGASFWDRNHSAEMQIWVKVESGNLPELDKHPEVLTILKTPGIGVKEFCSRLTRIGYKALKECVWRSDQGTGVPRK